MAKKARENEMEIGNTEEMEIDKGEILYIVRGKRKREKEITKKTTQRYEMSP